VPHGAAARPLVLLRTAGSFRLLFLATMASSLGTLLAAIALTLDVKERTDSGAWVSGLLIVEFLPTVIVGLTLGSLIDRLSRRRLMIAADLGRAALFCILPFAGSAAAVLALATAVGAATAFFRPAVYAGLPNLVEEDDLPAANSLLQGVENTMWAIGPMIGGALVVVTSVDVAYWFNAATFLVSALLIARIPGRRLQEKGEVSRGHWRDLGEGFALVRRSQALLAVLVSWSLALLGVGLLNVGMVFLAQDTFDAGPFGFGLLYGCGGIGLAIGSFAAGAVLSRRGITAVYPFSLALLSIGVALAAGAANIWLAAAAAVVAGIGNGVAIVCNAVLVQRGAPDRLRGRAFTVVISVTYGFLGIGMLIAGPLVDSAGPRWTWAAAAAVVGVSSAVAYLLVRGAPEAHSDEERHLDDARPEGATV
jgi:MFS family permease